MFTQSYPKECKIIEEDSYVDDIISSLDDTEEMSDITSGIEYVLQQGGFHVKQWISTLNQQESTKIQKVLGVPWNPRTDTLHCKVKLNFSKKHRNMYTEKNISANEVHSSIPDII